MSSGSLPLSNYHRAQSLGEGSYGSVMAVYNSDGEEYALKVFIDDDEGGDDDNEEDYDSDDEDYNERTTDRLSSDENGIDLGALREISILRILRNENKHENIIEMHDVKTPESDEMFDEDDCAGGAGTSGYVGMAMPMYPDGNLADALNNGLLKSSSRRSKVQLAHGLLSAVAFLHDNSIIHRDIKSDNIMISIHYDKKGKQSYNPVLIDFSLAKIFNGGIYKNDEFANNFWWEEELNPISSNTFDKKKNKELKKHTDRVGTVTYRAPEICSQQPYGLKSDLWSVGVVLLEVITNHTIHATKDKEALKMIREMKDGLPNDQPFPELIRGLLEIDPFKRWSARDALGCSLFQKFYFPVPPMRVLNMQLALPLLDDNIDDGSELIEVQDEEKSRKENISSNTLVTSKMTITTTARKKQKNKSSSILTKRRANIERLCKFLECKHPLIPHAALTYCQLMYQLDDNLDNLKESQITHDCVILACKYFETEVMDLADLKEDKTGLFEHWDLEEYYDNEMTIWMMMDFCLYPRKVIVTN